MNFNDLITKYPDESLRQAIVDAYQVGYDEGVQAAAGKVIASLGELQDAVNLKAGIETMGGNVDTWASYMHPPIGVIDPSERQRLVTIMERFAQEYGTE